MSHFDYSSLTSLRQKAGSPDCLSVSLLDDSTQAPVVHGVDLQLTPEARERIRAARRRCLTHGESNSVISEGLGLIDWWGPPIFPTFQIVSAVVVVTPSHFRVMANGDHATLCTRWIEVEFFGGGVFLSESEEQALQAHGEYLPDVQVMPRVQPTEH